MNRNSKRFTNFGIPVTYADNNNFRFRVTQSKEYFDVIIDPDGEYIGYKSGFAYLKPYLEAYGYKTGEMVPITRIGVGIVRVPRKGKKEVVPLREFNPEWMGLDLPAYKKGKPIDNFDLSNIKVGATIKLYRSEDFTAIVVAPHDNALLPYRHWTERYGDKMRRLAFTSCEFTYDGSKFPVNVEIGKFKAYEAETGETVLLAPGVSPSRVFSSVPQIEALDRATLEGLLKVAVEKYSELQARIEELEKELAEERKKGAKNVKNKKGV